MGYGNHIENRYNIIFISLIILGTIIITVFLIAFVIPALGSILNKLQPNELIAAFGVIIAMLVGVIPIILHRLDSSKSKKSRLEIQIETNDNLVRISSSFENSGTKRIIPKNVYLFIDEGIEKDGIFEFPYMLKHDAGENDCVLSIRCKQGGLQQYPSELCRGPQFNATYSKLISLKHLSSESILFIDPGEKFTEDSILRIMKTGVFRATVVFTAVNADCSCTTREFIIQTIESREKKTDGEKVEVSKC